MRRKSILATLLALSCGGAVDNEVERPEPAPSELMFVTEAMLPAAQVGEDYEVVLELANPPDAVDWAFGSGLPDGLTGAARGTTAVIAGVPVTPGDTSFVVSVSAPEYLSADRTFSIAVAPAIPPLEWVTTTLPGAEIGQAYSAELEVAGGVDGAFEWRMLNGRLPSGFAMEVDGRRARIFGAATREEVRTFIIEVVDESGQIASQDFRIAVFGPPQITTLTLPEAMVGSEYAATVRASGGEGEYAWTLEGAPSWMSATPQGANLFLGGTVSTEGPHTFGVRVTDAGGRADQRSLTVETTSVPPLVLQVVGPAEMETCLPQSITFSASGGVGDSLQWTLTSSGALGGLEYASDERTSRVQGYPSQPGRYTAVVRAEDLIGNSATATATFEVVGSSTYWVAVERLRVGMQNAEYALVNACGATEPPVPLRFNGGDHRLNSTFSAVHFSADGRFLLLAPLSERASLFEARLFDLSSGTVGAGSVVTHTPTTSAYMSDVTIDPLATRIGYSGIVDGEPVVFARDISNPAAPGPLLSRRIPYTANFIPGFDPSGSHLGYFMSSGFFALDPKGLNLMRVGATTASTFTLWPVMYPVVSRTRTKWSPDGRFMAFRVDEEAPFIRKLYLVDSQSMSPTRVLLTPNLPRVNSFEFSPDSRWLAFGAGTASNPSSNVLHLIDLKTGISQPGAVDVDVDDLESMAWSPSGDRLAYAGTSATVGAGVFYVRIGANGVVGSREIVVQRGANVVFPYPIHWSPDGQWLSTAERSGASPNAFVWRLSPTVQGFPVTAAGRGAFVMDFSADSKVLWVRGGVRDVNMHVLAAVTLSLPTPTVRDFAIPSSNYDWPSRYAFSFERRRAFGIVSNFMGSRLVRFGVDQDGVPLSPDFVDDMDYQRFQYRYTPSPSP